MSKARRPLKLCVDELGRVKHKGRTWVIGLSKLRKHGWRGVTFTPRRHGERVGAILASTHLPPYGPMIEETFIHEAIHAAFPKATEKEVVSAAALVAKVLRTVNRARTPRKEQP